MDNHDVISAFLDNEPFDPAELGAALGEPVGRDLLLDLVALRSLVRDESVGTTAARGRAEGSPQQWIAVGFLAASILFGAGAAWGLPLLLHQRGADVPPQPDHIVTFETGPSAP